jgi:hypothetical protein
MLEVFDESFHRQKDLLPKEHSRWNSAEVLDEIDERIG